VKCDSVDLLAHLFCGSAAVEVVVEDGVVRLKCSMAPFSGRRWRTWIVVPNLLMTRSLKAVVEG
jgi:hypothetical protein